MILTITMNPSVDKRYNLDEFKLGNVYRTSEYEYTPGGKGINVAKVLNLLGADLETTGLLGGNSGDFIIEELEKLNIKNRFIKIDGNTRGCLNIISGDGTQTEVLESGPMISNDEYTEFIREYKEMIKDIDVICASGSLAGGLSQDTYVELIDIARDMNKKFILDTSGDALAKGIEAKPYLIKPNENELKDLLNSDIDSEEDYIKAIKKLGDKDIEIVVVSLGDKGILAYNKGDIYRGYAPKIDVINTVGSGDSMIAGMAYGIKENYNIEDILRYGIACGTANAMEEETGKIDINNLENLLKDIEIKKI